ncbi:MAG: DNA repair protein RecO [Thiotrichaceae bacterium]|nr:DNA repair protein RecO [Thiotrichaceae bacterium]
MESAFILHRRPYHEHSVLVDLLTEHSGRITCIARVAKRKGKIMRGTIEPFRQLAIEWFGRGEVQTLRQVEERRHYAVPISQIARGLYFGELILKLLPKELAAPEVFTAYQQALFDLSSNHQALYLTETDLLASLGLDFVTPVTHKESVPINAQYHYQYTSDVGIELATHTTQGIRLSGQLLLNLYQKLLLDESQQKQYRQFLDHLINQQLGGRPLKTRKFAFEH